MPAFPLLQRDVPTSRRVRLGVGGEGRWPLWNPALRRHARNRMRRDHVAEADVLATVTMPDEVTRGGEGRINAWRLLPSGWLRVTYIQEVGGTVIITVTVLGRRGPQGG